MGIAKSTNGLRFRDDFNRTDRELSGDNGWTVYNNTGAATTGLLGIAGNVVAAKSSTAGTAINAAAAASADPRIVQALVYKGSADADSGNPVLFTHYVDTDNQTSVALFHDGTGFKVQLAKRVAATTTTLATWAVTYTAGDAAHLKFESAGDSKRVTFNGTDLGGVADTYRPSARAAARTWKPSTGVAVPGRFDNFVEVNGTAVYVTGLPAGYQARITGPLTPGGAAQSYVATESAGTATLGTGAIWLPFTTLEVLDGAGAVVESATVEGWGGDTYDYTKPPPTVTWSTSNAAVATVSSTGLVTVKGAKGTATITATATDDQGATATDTFLVTAAPEEILYEWERRPQGAATWEVWGTATEDQGTVDVSTWADGVWELRRSVRTATRPRVYSPVRTFTVENIVQPTITTDPATINRVPGSATMHGTITGGNQVIIGRGFFMDAANPPTTRYYADGVASGAYSLIRNGLAGLLYFKAFVLTEAGEVQGAVRNFNLATYTGLLYGEVRYRDTGEPAGGVVCIVHDAASGLEVNRTTSGLDGGWNFDGLDPLKQYHVSFLPIQPGQTFTAHPKSFLTPQA